MLLPPGLREDEIAKYPMLINLYSGPGSQVVKNNFLINFGYYLVTNRNIIYTLIDARGSGFQGDRLLFEIYRRLGTVEIEDQLIVAFKLTKIFKFIDPKRIALFGWSYGGENECSVNRAAGKEIQVIRSPSESFQIWLVFCSQQQNYS